MGTKKWEERNIRKIIKIGNSSMSVTIPIDDIRALGWREKQKVVVKRIGNKLIITDWKK